MQAEEFPDLHLPQKNLNYELAVFTPTRQLRIGEPIFFVVQVVGENTIIFPPDFNATIYRYQRNNREWIKVEKEPVEYQSGNWIIPPGEKGADWIIPKLSDSAEVVLLRIFVFGYIYQDGQPTDEKVGAYTDVILKP